MPLPPDDTPFHWTVSAKVAVTVFLVLTLAYALLIAQQVLARVFLVVIIVVIWYTARLAVAMEEIVTQLGHLADKRTGSRGRGNKSS